MKYFFLKKWITDLIESIKLNKWVNILLLLSFSLCDKGQVNDSTFQQLKEVVVTGYKKESLKWTPLNISSIHLDTLINNAFTISDILKRTEGVTMLSTGIGISKPVIRGLYGNRVLVLLNGLKFDNQQWQEEHGLGLTSFGLSKIELIKGPIGILYGSEAIGGVINLIEEEKPLNQSRSSDLSITMNSNTLGGMLQYGYLESSKNKWWRLRIGVDNHCDYSDGHNQRVLNSRFDGYYLKSTFGVEKNKRTSTFNYSFSMNRFGFIFDDIYSFIEPDKRWSRRLNDNPDHIVILNVFSNEHIFKFKPKTKLIINLGVQSNKRMENEGGGAISLNMHLLTLQGMVKLNFRINKKHHLIFSNLNAFENNTNYGARKIVPDAIMQESNISIHHEFKPTEKILIENGLGTGIKFIKTYFTPNINDPGKEIKPFQKWSPYYNGFTGVSYFPSNKFNLKFNLATGVRVANLAELSSNGLHEGVFVYEIGDYNLKNEQIYSANLFCNWDLKLLTISISPFYNYFNNYIYLTPSDEQWFGFPVSRYHQQNVYQYGSEFKSGIRISRNWQFNLAYSGMISKTLGGDFTPYLPAQRLTPQLDFSLSIKNAFKLSSYANWDYYFAQNKTAPNEKSTPAYGLLNAGFSLMPITKKFTINISGNNLLNVAYADHLSRLKNFGLLNIGRNYTLGFKIFL